jgi:hypothetical protein
MNDIVLIGGGGHCKSVIDAIDTSIWSHGSSNFNCNFYYSYSNSFILFSNRVHPLPISYKKLIQLFVIVVVYTLLIYPVFYLDWWFVWKILIKVLLLLSFIIVSIKLKYIKSDVIKSTFLTMMKFNFK